MGRKTIFRTGVVVIMALLVATALPANVTAVGGGEGAIIVGENHTDYGTDTEPDPTTLENVTVQGSGDAAYLQFARSQSEDIITDSVYQDGDGFTYQIDDLDAASDPVVNLTGETNNETESKTWDGLKSTTIDPEASGSFITGPLNGNPVAKITGASTALKTAVDTGEQGYNVGSADVDDDGISELIIYDTNENLLVRDVVDATTTDTGEQVVIFVTGDTDGDGVSEIVFKDTSDNILIRDVVDATTTDTGESGELDGTGDVDGDGTDEIVFRDSSANVYIRDEADATTDDAGIDSYSVVIGDTDGDGIGELIYRTDAANNLKIHDEPDGTTSDTGEQTYGRMVVDDFDDDGLDEIAFVDTSDNFKIRDESDGTTSNTSNQADALAVGDIDGDSIPETSFRDLNNNLKTYDIIDDDTSNTGLQADRRAIPVGDVDGDAFGEIGFIDSSDNIQYADQSSSNGTLDIADDGDDDVSFSVGVGETKDYELSSLSVGDSIGVSSDNNIDLNITLTENTQTKDPGVEINTDNWLNHTGTLADGETVSLTGNSSWLSEGTNTVNVSMPSLSADAPTMKVGVNYTQPYQSAAAPATYISDPYQASYVQDGWLNIQTIDNITADVEWQYSTDGGSTWQTVATATYTTTGNKTTDLSGTSADLWRLRVDTSKDGSDPTLEITDDGVHSQSYVPELTNASPDGQSFNSENVSLSVDLDDKDFGTQHGDSVTVTFYDASDDSQIASFSDLSSAQTVTTTWSELSDGTHDWYAEATDEYGNTVTTSTKKLTVNHYAPDLSNPDPTGETLRYENVTLSADLRDGDFAVGEDSVTLTWYVDGTEMNTTAGVTTNDTYSVTVGPFADGTHDWHVEATDEYGKTDSTDTKSFTIDHYDPQISDLQPTGDLDAKPTEISAQINDTDFSKDGDSLTVVFNLDGTQIDSQTISSNQTATTSMPDSGQLGGSHSISIEVTDDYGQTSSESAIYSTPSTFYIRNELNYSELIPADGEVRFFAEDAVYSRTAPDGKLNMTGLPVDQDFIVEVQPTDGNFTTRTIYLEGIYEQQNAYVLNTSAVTTIEGRFTLNDPTGRYGSESLLKIQKAINISGNVRYQTIVSDEFGVEGVTAVLQEGQRYELRVAADEFSQSVGPYRAATSETVAVEPGRSDVPLEDGAEPWNANAIIQNDTIEWRYSDTQQESTQLVVWAYERGNKTNTVIANQTYTDLGNASGAGTVPPSRIDQEYVVEFEITRDGETFTHVERLSNRKNLTLPIAPGWQSMIGVGLLILLAGAFSVLNAGIGAVIVTMVGGILWFVGFLSGATSAAAIAIAFLVSVLGHALSSTR